MNDKKNIDRLFQEKFKNFEVTPDEAVWKKIQARKNKDRDRILLIPFWYRIAGVAALVAVILTVGSLLNSNDRTTNPIVVTEDSENIDTNASENENSIIPNRSLVNADKNQETNYTSEANKSFNTTNEAITNNSNSTENNNQKTRSLEVNPDQITSISNQNITKNNNRITVKNNDNQKITGSNKQKPRLFKETSTTTTVIAGVQNPNSYPRNEENNSIANSNISSKKENKIISTLDPSENNSHTKNIQFQDPTLNKDTIKEAIADQTAKKGQTIDEEEQPDVANNPDQEGKSIFDAIKEKEEKETIIATSSTRKKWNIAPNVAPVYYDSFGGSSINQTFSDNTKQGQVNLSYGIQVAYAINDKLSIRSGLSKVDVGYNTEGVGFGISSVGRFDGTINPSNIRNIVVSDFVESTSNFATSPPDINNEILIKSQNPGLLNHSFEYLEVPIELKYAITDNKLGVHMIGGVSTLFLEDEEATIIAGNFRNNNIEREETVSEISFSGNIGLGFDYKLSDQFQINMEPIFKYQFSGFRESAENFRPYYFGIYTGISFKF